MKEFVCGIILLIGVISAEKVLPKQEQNSTKEESNISKRYIFTIPQYNSLFYGNSQVLPQQQLLVSNPQLINYIRNLQLGVVPYSNAQRYYSSPQNYLQSYPVRKVVPQFQSNIVPAIQVNSQQLLAEEVPQQVVQQQIVRQQVAPQQVVPQQVTPQEVISQQGIPQQVIPQQVIPQQVIPQQVVPQVIPRQFIPQQILQQQEVSPQPVIQQQIVPQQIAQQQVVPQQVQGNIVPTYPPQQIIPQAFSQQRVIPYQIARNIASPLQYQFYQQPRPQTIVGNEPYPYELPSGQNSLPVTHGKQIPTLGKNQGFQRPVYLRIPQVLQQVYPFNTAQNLFYNIPPQQEVKIGYGHPQFSQEVIQNTQPHTVYVQSNLQTYSDGYPNVVRIGYGHPHLGHEGPLQEQNGPQQVKLNIPVAYGTQNYNNDNTTNDRSTRTPAVPEKDELKQKEAEITKS